MVTSFIIMDDIYPGKGGIPFTWKIIVGRGRSLLEPIGYLIPVPDFTDRIQPGVVPFLHLKGNRFYGKNYISV